MAAHETVRACGGWVCVWVGWGWGWGGEGGGGRSSLACDLSVSGPVCRPEFLDDGEGEATLELRESRHPCAAGAGVGEGAFIPNDIVLGGDSEVGAPRPRADWSGACRAAPRSGRKAGAAPSSHGGPVRSRRSRAAPRQRRCC